MVRIPVPNSFGVRLREFNPNHEPAGTPIGGQFASAQGGGTAATGDARQQFDRLKAEWTRLNEELRPYLDNPNAPEAQAKVERQKALCKQMFAMNLDPGDNSGIGLPGGPRDVVIIGAGPGGMTAAMMTGSNNLDTLLLDANAEPGGQSRYSSRIENYPGFPIGVSGRELAEKMYAQAQRLGAETQLGVRVTKLTYDETTGLKTLTLSDGSTVQARAVILAGGLEFRHLDFPGSDSESVTYGDGEALAKLTKGGTAVVIGGANSAAQAALGVAQNAEHVYLISRSPLEDGMDAKQAQAVARHPKITTIIGDEIGSLDTDASHRARTLYTKNGKTIHCNALGIFIGSAPKFDWLGDAIERKNGKVLTDTSLQTKMPGVYAIGDGRWGGLPRIGSAVGEGQIAAISVWTHLHAFEGK